MKVKLTHVLFLTFACIAQTVLAQERQISGMVTDDKGLPLPGATILIQGTNTGTQTDFDGNYTIRAEVGQTLEYSFVGFAPQQATVTATTATVNIQLGLEELEEVVVTALGIKREKKALGFAVTDLESDALEERATGDLTKVLMGKASGVHVVNASGLSGAGASVVIRGLTSTGNNQPLYVVDGVRFNSDPSGSGFFGTSRSFDLDPNNIESVNVLKGLSATALYGADGKNGVILITTKAGNTQGSAKKTEITVNTSTFFTEISSLPRFTNQRGQGYYDAFYNFFGNWGATFGRHDYGNVDAQGQVPHPYYLNSAVFADAFPDETRADYRNYRSQENFFRTGVANNTNVSVNGGTDKAAYNLFVSNLKDQGFMPGNTVRRTNISVGGHAHLSNKFSVNATLNHSASKFTAPFQSLIYDALYNTPRSINLHGWPYEHPVTGEEISFQATSANPYWMLHNSGYLEHVTRSYGKVGATYEFNDRLSAVYNFGLDNAVVQRRSHMNRGDISGGLGSMSNENRRQLITNHTLMLNYSDRYADESVGLSIEAGVDVSQNKERYAAATSENQIIFGGLEHRFFEEHSATSGEYTRNLPGVFGQMVLDYENYIYLTTSARNDWVSNFVNNSQFYPGIGLSFIPTTAFENIKGEGFNYLKLRANYGSSADFTVPGSSLFGVFNPYPIFQVVGTNPRGFALADGSVVATNTVSGVLANRELKPALIEEYEFGLETRLWKNRIDIDASYFKRVTSDLIFERQLDPATGFTSTPQNVNEFEVEGIEIQMQVDAIQSENFAWSIGGNFTTNKSVVTSLEEDRFAVTGFATPSGDVGNYLVEGEPVNVLMGSVIATDEEGNYLTNGREYIVAEDIEILGDPNPDFIASFFTAIDYKNLSLTANLQWIQGGDFYSASARSLLARGLTTDTDGLNNVGYVLPGVLEDTGEENHIVISSGDAYFNEYSNGPAQFGIFDATSIRLQELALRYRFTPEQLRNTPFGALSIALVGENLYYRAINMPKGLRVDTNTIGTGIDSSGAGIETLIGPAGRRYGLSIRASF